MANTNITVLPGTVSGTVRIPASKSLSHRAIICAALAEGDSSLHNVSWSQDIEATVFAMERMGAIIWRDRDVLSIRGIGGRPLQGRVERIFCGESASTARFLIPVAGVLGLRAIFTGMGRLPKRPLDVYLTLMEEHGIAYEKESDEALPLTIKGQWESGIFRIPGNVSSQFVSGLLMALPMAQGDSVVEVTTPLESASYVDITVEILRRFGIRIERDGERIFRIPGGQQYKGGRYSVESDYSQAAVLLAAGAIAGEPEGLILEGLNPHSVQGDRTILDILREMRVETRWLENGGLQVFPAADLRNITMDASQTPDLVPPVAAMAAFGTGTMRILNASRLRLKESDRLHAIAVELRKMGVRIIEMPGGLQIVGEPDGLYEGGAADTWGDHRVAMCLSVLALRTFQGIELSGADCIDKSWPNFWNDFSAIGGGVIE